MKAVSTNFLWPTVLELSAEQEPGAQGNHTIGVTGASELEESQQVTLNSLPLLVNHFSAKTAVFYLSRLTSR